MNTNTGQIREMEDVLRSFKGDELRAHEAGWVAVPQELTRQARRLQERNEAVKLNGQSKLAKFAREKRKEQKAARRKNRK